MILTKDEKGYILSLIDRNTDDLSRLEGAIYDDDWIYDIYDTANSIRDKFEKDNDVDIIQIIFEKRIDLESFYTTFIENNYDYNYYEKMYGTYGKYKLTQEEFDSLREVYYEKCNC